MTVIQIIQYGVSHKPNAVEMCSAFVHVNPDNAY